ncbi:Hint domain-containing protein [Nisaea sediminum]|uniref:Hint domain-containing protein n=1 Tax=Nisaea sediminum TaxID=2775867 RepID=UPI0018696C42|nr:Hint domain-containing protein [Nisaea sediminum]
MASAIDRVLAKSPEREQVALDVTDGAVLEFLQDSYARAGLGPERAPGLHRKLQEQHELDPKELAAAEKKATAPTATMKALDDDGWESGAVDGGVGKTSSGGYATSTGFVTFVGGVSSAYSVIQVIAPTENNKVLASGQNAGFDGATTVPLMTNATGAQPMQNDVKVNIIYSYQVVPGAPLQHKSYQTTVNALGGFEKPTVDQPKQTAAHVGNSAIKIGLGRGPIGQNKADVDYWFWQGTNDTTYAVPFVGNVNFPQNVDTPLTVGTNFFPEFTLTRTDGGYKKLMGQGLTNAVNGFSVSGQTLSWRLPATNEAATTNPIVFGALNWQTESNVFLTAQFPATLADGTLGFAAVVSTDQTPPETIGTAYIKPIWFVYHCVAPGTLVTLDDGTTAKIEDISVGRKVRVGADGRALPVLANAVAPHRGEAFRLKTSAGRELTMSFGHLVLTPFGPLRAQDLVTGGEVLTEKGTEKIVSIEEIFYDGLFYNLEIDDPEADGGSTLFANGVQIGDMRMQADHRRSPYRDVKASLSRIDPDFHQDFLNHLSLAL